MKKVVNCRPLFYIFMFLLCGIVSARRIFAKDLLTIIVISLALALTILWLCSYKKYKILAILLLTFCLGLGLSYMGEATYKINSYDGQVSVVGRITDSFKEDKYYYSIVLDDVYINGKSDKNISIYVSKNDNKQLNIGDKLVFETHLESISLWTLKTFNSNFYRQNIGYTSQVYSSNLVAVQGKMKADEVIRQNVKNNLERTLSKENAGLCYALLFGDKLEVESDTLSSYKQAGVIHILAVSGLHVSFLIGLIYFLLKLCRASKEASFVVTTLFIILFAYLCSFSPSVVRAGLMGIFFMFSKLIGRRYDTLSSLGFAGILILLFSPLSAFDLGYLMSVFCVIGICLLSKIINKALSKVMSQKVSMALSVSIASQIITLPFLGYFGGSLNFLSPFVNLIIVPFFGVLFPYLVITCLITAILPFMNFLILPAGWGFSAVTSLIRFFGNTSLILPVEKLHISVIIVFFIIMFVFSKFVLYSTRQKAVIVGGLSILMAVMGFASTSMIKNDFNTVTYLSYNNQDCYVFSSKNGQRLIVGYNSLIKNYARISPAKKYDYFLSCQPIDEDDITFFDGYEVQNYVACLGDISFDGVIQSEQGNLGDYTYAFLKNGDKILGVSVSLGSARIFIAQEASESYNSTYQEYFSVFEPTIVFVGKNDFLSGGLVAVSQDKNNLAKFSHEKEGNMRFIFASDGVYKEVLD